MNNSYDEIKKLLKASNNLFQTKRLKEEITHIKKSHNILTEQEDIVSRIDPIQDSIDDSKEEEESKKDKQQSYRISGNIITLHGKDKVDLELTTDEKKAFQETIEEFTNEVSELVDFDSLNIYKTNVEWGGKIIDFDIEFYFTLGETNGLYVKGDMIKVDENYSDMVNKLKTYYNKFKIKWGKILADRKKIKPSEK
jgi:hypothetical protein